MKKFSSTKRLEEPDFILKNRNTIKLRFDEIKKELINKKNTDNYFSFVNVQKEEFKQFLNDL